MKFCQLLRNTAEHLPEMHSLFVLYKQMKKHLKQMQLLLQEGNFRESNEHESRFVESVNSNLHYLNVTFVEKEEHMVMKLEQLEREARGIVGLEGCESMMRRFVDFHGEMVLFMHWSMLAYTSMVKILKKHQKKTGLQIPTVQRDNLVTQPICSTKVCLDLIHRVEDSVQGLQQMHTRLAAQQIPEGSGPEGTDRPNPQELEAGSLTADAPLATSPVPETQHAQAQEIVDQVQRNLAQFGHIDQQEAGVNIFHQTQVALDTWERLRSSAATPSTFLEPQAPQDDTYSSCASQNGH